MQNALNATENDSVNEALPTTLGSVADGVSRLKVGSSYSVCRNVTDLTSNDPSIKLSDAIEQGTRVTHGVLSNAVTRVRRAHATRVFEHTTARFVAANGSLWCTAIVTRIK